MCRRRPGAALERPRAHHGRTDRTVAFNPCPVLNTLDSGSRTNFVPFLPFNRWTTGSFSFSDGFANITESALAADVNVRGVGGIPIWAQGVVSTNAGAPAGMFVDFGATQNYATVPTALANFTGWNRGVCNAPATLAADGTVADLFVNRVGLATGGSGNCSPFNEVFAGTGRIGATTNLAVLTSGLLALAGLRRRR